VGPLAAVVVAYLACLDGGTPGACRYADELATRNHVGLDDLRATIDEVRLRGLTGDWAAVAETGR
jgi:hypothetical protein